MYLKLKDLTLQQYSFLEVSCHFEGIFSGMEKVKMCPKMLFSFRLATILVVLKRGVQSSHKKQNYLS